MSDVTSLRMVRIHFPLLLATLGFLGQLFTASLSHGAEGAKKPEAPKQTFSSLKIQTVEPAAGSWESQVTVFFELGETEELAEILSKDKIELGQIKLLLNDFTLATGATLSKKGMSFNLIPRSDYRKAWEILVSKTGDTAPAGFIAISSTKLGVKLDSNVKFTFQFFDQRRKVIGWIIIIVLLVLLVVLACKSDILRDRIGTAPMPPARHPYSLARCQIAFWTFIVLSAYFLIYMASGEINGIITSSELVLLGLSVLTTMGASLVDNSKITTNAARNAATQESTAGLQAEIKAIEEEIQKIKGSFPASPATPPLDASERLKQREKELAEKQKKLEISKPTPSPTDQKLAKPVFWLTNILDDGKGISIHRFQMLSWTLILGYLFVAHVIDYLTMPKFDPMLLGLMGISSGSYVALKTNEGSWIDEVEFSKSTYER